MQKVSEFKEIAKVQVKTGFLFLQRDKDPTMDMVISIESFIKNERLTFNKKVIDNFDLEDGEFTKFEFHWLPERAKILNAEGKNSLFRMKCFVNTIYLKPKSFVYFETEFRFDLTSGCGNNGTIKAFGGKNYEMEEVYFNKVSSVKSIHNEEIYEVINSGCFAKPSQITINQDGLIIRAGENFRIFASDKFAQELTDARKLINKKIADVN